ncbi:MAG: SGNH/GDSL hydrolase family protein [Candidatus Nomurabacteria bacterium]|nr:MAG: SGNH/GDSL hydrolase family protein [Candidatus Nomurabacteria bacterium]
MNTNPQAKVILCYGDSNTWGQNDDKNTGSRYPVNVRWTGKLQELLGNDYYVIEEGLGGRTTDLEHYNPDKPSRNGLTYFVPCLTSHSPTDIVVIMLGTNDLKVQYSRPVAEIADALKPFINAVREASQETKILSVSPIYVNDRAPKFDEYYHDTYDQQSAEKSKQLATEIQRVASETGSLFFDASTVAKAGLDGIHFDQQSHPALVQAVAEIFRSRL